MDIPEPAIGVYPNMAIDPMTGLHAATGEPVEIPAWARLDGGTCRFEPFPGEDTTEWNAVRGVCSKCSALMHGKDSYCPNCGRKVDE